MVEFLSAATHSVRRVTSFARYTVATAALLIVSACAAPSLTAEEIAEREAELLIQEADRLAAELEACQKDSSNCSGVLSPAGAKRGANVGQNSYFPDRLKQPSVTCDFGNGARQIAPIGEIQDEWYGAQLRAAGEPILHVLAEDWRPGSSILRFTWLRTFHQPVFVSIRQLDGDVPHLTAKQLLGAGGYAPGTIAKTVERDLSRTEAARLRQLLEKTDLLAMPPKSCELGFDGSQWLFEGVDSDGYHLVDRWSPEKGPVYKVGTYLLLLTGWKFDEVY